MVATNTLAGELPSASSRAQVGGVSYELLLLSCMVDGLSKIVAVAAVAAGEARTNSRRQTQLLAAIAMHLFDDCNDASGASSGQSSASGPARD